jgi:DNA invertase Pin-like site-specific DNA recombinase
VVNAASPSPFHGEGVAWQGMGVVVSIAVPRPRPSALSPADGGLGKSTRRKLQTLAKALRTTGRVAPTPSLSLKPGARLMREWHGRAHTVMVTEDGFEYAGSSYPSLTKIANKITGAHWSGPRFFGLRAAAGAGRPSHTDQDLSIQETALRAAGCEVIRAEKRSGTTTAGREELRTVLDFLRRGDVLMVTRIDRLARSIGELQDIVRAIRAKGAALKATEQPIDTSTAAGKCFLDMLGVFAQFETNLRKERQLEGIAKAKAEGAYKGRPVSIDVARVRAMKEQGTGATAIAKALSIHRASVYRLLEEGADARP